MNAAADLDWDGVALVDHDGLWGCVQHLTACADTGVNAHVGVNLAVEPIGYTTHRRRTLSHADRLRAWNALGAAGAPGRAAMDAAARVQAYARPGAWGALTRLLSAAYARGPGKPARPVVSLDMLGEFTAAGGALLLGPDSEAGRALAAGRADLAWRFITAYRRACTDGSVAFAVPYDADATPRAVRYARDAISLGDHMAGAAPADGGDVTCVLAPHARYIHSTQHASAHLLDAIRTKTPLPTTPTPRAAHVSPARAARAWLTHIAGGRRGDALAAHTHAWWQACTLTGADAGIGTAHPPEDNLVTATSGGCGNADVELRERCYGAIHRCYPGVSADHLTTVRDRLDAELRTIRCLHYAAFFLTTTTVADLARDLGIRAQARGSAVGSLVCHLLGLSPIDPISHRLLAERFCTTRRTDLPDIDLDVESARRHEVYEAAFAHFGTERVAAVGMVDTFRARSAIREVGAAVGVRPDRVDVLAKAAPWQGSRDMVTTFATLPELAARRLVTEDDRWWLNAAQELAGVPRHPSMHPCGLVMTNTSLGDRVAVQATGFEWPMCQLDKHDVETMGLLKVDILGVRMQSAIAHGLAEIERTSGAVVQTEDVPEDDEATFELLRTTQTVGVFQVESPGQRALGSKLCPASMTDITAQISLFRPGPVQADMITPFVAVRHGLAERAAWPSAIEPIVAATGGVVIWHEQVIEILGVTSGIDLAAADLARRRLGSAEGREEVKSWWWPATLGRGFSPEETERIWGVLSAFGSFGFCKAHAAAFARTTFESAWLKAHHPAEFFAGLLEHSPGLYPTRVLLAEARRLGVAVRGVCVEHSQAGWSVELTGDPVSVVRIPEPASSEPLPRSTVPLTASAPHVTGFALRVPLTAVVGITAAEVERLLAGRPYAGVQDVWERARPSAPVLEALAEVGALRCTHAGVGAASAREQVAS